MTNKQLFDNMANALITGEAAEAKKIAENLTKKQCQYIIIKCDKVINGFDMGEMLDFAEEIREVQTLAQNKIKSHISLIDYINMFYAGVVTTKDKTDRRITIISPFFNTLLDIKRNEFNNSAVIQQIPNTNAYILYSNSIH
jgi:hypothetical protein